MFKTAILAASGLMLALVEAGPSPGVGNGPPTQTGGSDLNAFQEADNFTLASAMHVSQVTFYSLQTNASDYAGSTDWSFNSDAMGAPGTVLFSGNSVAVGVATGNSAFGLTEFSYTFSVSFDLPAGTYWLVLHNGPSAAIPATTCYWAWSAGTGDSQGSDLLTPAWVTNSAELAFQLTTGAPISPTSTCQTISGAVQGYAITPVTMTGSGGSGAPYTFSATGLPNGLGISSDGTISGTPTVNGTFNYTVTVTDSGSHQGTANCSVTVDPPPTASCVTISGAVQGYAITPVTMTGSGGVGGPYSFSATGLPNGLGISSGGTISGTPTVNGTFNYTVTVTDSGSHSGNVNCSVTVNPPPAANCVTINATQGVAITPVTMTGNGGAGGPYSFSATGLPNGLSISSGGTISGTPTVQGTFNYTVTVTDSASHNGSVNCSVTVKPPKPPVPTVNISVSPTQVREGNSATFTIAASANVPRSTTVHYSMSGKAILGTDYTLNGTSGEATIATGHSSTTVILRAVNDKLTEGNESAIMTITPNSKYTVGPNNNAALTIQDN